MTQHPTPATDQPSDDRSWARPLFEQQIALLSELAEAGMTVATTIRDQVVAEQGDLLALAGTEGVRDRLGRLSAQTVF